MKPRNYVAKAKQSGAGRHLNKRNAKLKALTLDEAQRALFDRTMERLTLENKAWMSYCDLIAAQDLPHSTKLWEMYKQGWYDGLTKKLGGDE